MKELKREEMLEVNGGASTILIASVIGIIITFVVGALKGYSNPEKCNTIGGNR